MVDARATGAVGRMVAGRGGGGGGGCSVGRSGDNDTRGSRMEGLMERQERRTEKR